MISKCIGQLWRRSAPISEKTLANQSRCPKNIAAIVAKGFFSRTIGEGEILSGVADGTEPLSVDVQAAISVIGRRGVGQREHERIRRDDKRSGAPDAWRLDLTNCHLARPNFAGLDFAGARFIGSSLYFSNS
jgi:hypothetical protein